MKFQYVGVTRQRESVKGVIDAADEVEARVRLRAMQVRVTKLAKKSESQLALKLAQFSLGAPIDLKGLIIFTRQFSSLVDSGVPIVQCLDILHKQEKRKRFQKVLAKIKEDIEGGGGLAEALAKHPRVFSDFYVRIVEAGEMSGTLDKALRRAGQQLEKLGRLKAKVIKAMIYPMMTLLVAVVVLVFMLLKVIPAVAKLYGESQAKLPEITIFVLGISKWVQDYFFYMIMGAVVIVVGFILAYRIPAFRAIVDRVVLQVPLFGSLLKKSTIARFSRTLSTLVASGVPLLQSFEICAKLVGNVAIQDIIRRSAQAVSEGKSIASGLMLNSLFPPMVVHMVSIGEMTGRLDELLGKVADIYDDEVDDAVDALTGLLQPMLIVFVGGIIAFLLLAMYLPIFQLAEKVAGG